jgi:nucleoside phosphorylase
LFSRRSWVRRMIEAALRRLEHPDPRVRKLGAQALASAGAGGALAETQNLLLSETNPGVVKWLALALGRNGHPSSITIIDAKLKLISNEDSADWLRLTRALLLGEVRRTRIGDLLQSRSDEALLAGLQMSWVLPAEGDQLQRLGQLIEHSDAHVRRWAALALGASNTLKSAAPILPGLDDDDFLVREWSEWSLAKLKDPAAIHQLRKRLLDPHPRVREWAIKALAAYGRVDLFEVIAEAYPAETDLLCREATIRSLGSWPNPRRLREFALGCASVELEPFLLLALIDLVATVTILRRDHDVLAALSSAVARQPTGDLQRELWQQLYGSLGSRERQAVNVLRQNVTVRFLLDEEERRSRRWREESVGDQSQLTRAERQPAARMGLIIALPEEFRELQHLSTDWNPIRIGGNTYFRFALGSDEAGRFGGVALLLGGYGGGRAAVLTRDLLHDWQLEIVASVGIAAGIHEDVLVGDVIVANQTDDYLLGGRISQGDGSQVEFEFSGEPFRPSNRLLKEVVELEFKNAPAFSLWRRQGAEDLETLLSNESARQLFDANLIRRYPVVEQGKIASGPIVGQTEIFAKWLHEHDRSYKALEMESAGVALADYLKGGPEDIIVIRGISDLGDARKKQFDAVGGGALRRLAMRNTLRLLGAAFGAQLRPEAHAL